MFLMGCSYPKGVKLKHKDVSTPNKLSFTDSKAQLELQVYGTFLIKIIFRWY